MKRGTNLADDAKGKAKRQGRKKNGRFSPAQHVGGMGGGGEVYGKLKTFLLGTGKKAGTSRKKISDMIPEGGENGVFWVASRKHKVEGSDGASCKFDHGEQIREQFGTVSQQRKTIRG